jgi:hypothetical protein
MLADTAIWANDIREAIRHDLMEHGMVEATSGRPDFYVAYYEEPGEDAVEGRGQYARPFLSRREEDEHQACGLKQQPPRLAPVMKTDQM